MTREDLKKQFNVVAKLMKEIQHFSEDKLEHSLAFKAGQDEEFKDLCDAASDSYWDLFEYAQRLRDRIKEMSNS